MPNLHVRTSRHLGAPPPSRPSVRGSKGVREEGFGCPRVRPPVPGWCVLRSPYPGLAEGSLGQGRTGLKPTGRGVHGKSVKDGLIGSPVHVAMTSPSRNYVHGGNHVPTTDGVIKSRPPSPPYESPFRPGGEGVLGVKLPSRNPDGGGW